MAQIEITTKIGCKNACEYCPQETLAKAYNHRNSEIYERIIDFIHQVDNE